MSNFYDEVCEYSYSIPVTENFSGHNFIIYGEKDLIETDHAPVNENFSGAFGGSFDDDIIIKTAMEKNIGKVHDCWKKVQNESFYKTCDKEHDKKPDKSKEYICRSQYLDYIHTCLKS
jgi:hypothetical protein